MSDSPLFSLGAVVATPGVLGTFSEQEIAGSLYRHQHGDWGDLDVEDSLANNEALTTPDSILSSYICSGGRKLWIITEWDRSITTVLLPDEY